MNWRKAHRNRKRVEARARTFPFVFPFHVLTAAAFYEVAAFHELVNQMINERCDTARVLMRKPESLATWRTQQMPPLPPFRGTRFNVEAVRRQTGSRFFMIVDDVDFSRPCEPRPRKRFIYGDHWIAYQNAG